eukprot:745598-Hanusia_phi.AAC.1
MGGGGCLRMIQRKAGGYRTHSHGSPHETSRGVDLRPVDGIRRRLALISPVRYRNIGLPLELHAQRCTTKQNRRSCPQTTCQGECDAIELHCRWLRAQQLASKFNLGDDLLKDLIPQAGLNLRSMIAGSLNVFCLCCFVAGLAMDKNLYRLIVGQITVVDFFAITAKEMLEYTSNMLRKGYAAASRSVQDGKEWSVKMSGEQARADRDNAKKQFPPGSIGNPLLQGN